MNILLINHYAGSPEHGMEYRPFYMAREWVKKGHTVTILAASHTHVRSTQPKISGPFTEENIQNIQYIWLKTPVYEGNNVKRILNILAFTTRLRLNTTYFAKTYTPDVVIASSTYPLDNMMAHRIAKKANGKYIYEVHDLWPLSPMELGGYSSHHPYIRYLQHAENYAYKHCDHVVSIIPKTKEHMMAHGLAEYKFHHIPNGIFPEDWDENQPIPEEHQSLLDGLKNQGKTIIAYAGNHGTANALYSLMDAFAMIKTEPVDLVLIGNGQEKKNLIRYANTLDLDQVHFLPAVPKTAIPKLLTYPDILYIGLQKQSLFRFGICPNKLMDYLMAGKPIIQAIEAGNDMVTEQKCGITIEPENPQAIVNAIQTLMAMSPKEREKLGNNGKDYVTAHHDYKKLAQQFLELMKK